MPRSIPAAAPLFAVLLALAGCARFSRTTTVPRIQPPVGTGQVETDFRGDWTVIEVRAAGVVTGEGGSGPLASGFTLPSLGSVVTFDDLGFVATARQEMRRERMTLDASLQITDYLNQANRRFALYILKIEPQPAVGGQQFDQVQLAFGTEDQDHLLGLVSFHAAPTGGNPVRTGVFLARLQRR